MKRPPVPPTGGQASVDIGRPRAVEKGSTTRTLPMDVGTGLCNLADRNTADSRSFNVDVIDAVQR